VRDDSMSMTSPDGKGTLQIGKAASTIVRHFESRWG
jgi:hypothetical protein